MKKPLLLFTFSVMALSLLHTQSVLAQASLVKDINTTPALFRPENDYSNLFCNCGNYLFFIVANEKGSEIWRTDGTSEGTFLLKDVYPGYQTGVFQGMTCNGNGKVLFPGYNPTYGIELWSSDGTVDGTTIVKDIVPGVGGAISMLGLFAGNVFFTADQNADNQWEIWKSDGTEGNTVLVTTLEDYEGFAYSYVTMITDTHIFFSLYNSTTGKFELWSTDGTPDNTTKLTESGFVLDFGSLGDKLVYSQTDPTDYTNNLWVSDGTFAGTAIIKDLEYSYAYRFNKFNDKLIFTFGGNAWITDGTEAGTLQLASGYIDGSAVINNVFYGVGYDFGISSYRLLNYNGTTVSTVLLEGDNFGDILTYGSIPVLNDKMILQYRNDNTGVEPGISDATFENFEILKDINPGVESSYPRAWGKLNDQVYFLADDGTHGTEIWATDGTPEGSYLVKDIIKGTAIGLSGSWGLESSGGKIHLLASTTDNYYQADLYVSDGTSAGTVIKHDFESGTPNLFGKTDDDLIYFHDQKFYKTRGSASALSEFKDLTGQYTGGSLTYRTYYTLGNKLIFAIGTYGGTLDYGREYWVTDGTDNGTYLLKDVNPGMLSGISENGFVHGTKFIFDGTDPDHGTELWISDGTTDGTTLLKDIFPGAADSSKPSSFGVVNDKIIFSAADADHGLEIWTTNGTPEGTTLLIDLVAGTTGSEAKYFKSIGDVTLFTAYDAVNGWALWKTNGTSAGTVMIKDIDPSTDKSRMPGNFTAIGNKLYFACDDGEHGSELWVSDGTEDGTQLIDIVPGAEGSYPSVFKNINGIAYFKANNELWRSDGTANGTSRVSELEPIQMLLLDSWVYFTAHHPDYGIELFKVEFPREEQQLTIQPIGTKNFDDATFTIEASASSGLPVTFSAEELTFNGNTATIVKAGMVELIVKQEGSALFKPVQETVTFCILPSKPTITVSHLTSGRPVLTSSADEGNQWYEGEIVLADNSEKTFQPEKAGAYKLKVTREGCASTFSDEEIINKIDQQITFADMGTKTFGDADFQIEASASSGLPVTVTSSDELTLVNNTATIVNPGTVELVAQQAGDGLFNAAEITTTFCILPATPSISVFVLSLGGTIVESSAEEGNQWYKDGVTLPGNTDKSFEPVVEGNYKVNVTVDGCTSEFSDEQVILITGLETTAHAISFYPNPASETVRIAAGVNSNDVKLNILDMHGKSIATYQLNQNDFVDHSVKDYPNGLYLIQVITNKGMAYQKLVKKINYAIDLTGGPLKVAGYKSQSFALKKESLCGFTLSAPQRFL